MTYPFRNISPKRTCTKHYSQYNSYKPFLAEDFNHKCGYTDCSDYWFGGQRNFQIDHLKPKSKYPQLKSEYSNLVYCCSYVNRAKLDDDNPNYLDPCNVDYNLHFERDDNGYIVGKTPQGCYMVEHLQLNLFRYAICWYLDRLREKISILKEVARDSIGDTLLLKLYDEYDKYEEYLKDNL